MGSRPSGFLRSFECRSPPTAGTAAEARPRPINRGSGSRSSCSRSPSIAALQHRFVWFLLDWLVLGVAVASMLVVDSWWVTVFASLVAALWIARLFVIGHDACHGSYTPNKRLNEWIGRLAFLPS